MSYRIMKKPMIGFPKIAINILLCLALLAMPSALAADDAKKLKQKQTTINKQQRKLNGEVNKLQLDLISIANRNQEIQAKIIRIEERVGLLASQELQQRKTMLGDNQKLGDTLSAMLQISDKPDKLFLIYPADGLAAARSHLLVSYITPRLQNRIKDISGEIAELRATQQKLQNEKILLFETSEDLAENHIRITRLVENKNRLLKVNQTTLKKLAVETKTLQKAARNVEELVKKASATKSTAKADRTEKPRTIRKFPVKGKITLPAKGKIIRNFGQKTAFGLSSRGIMLKTRVNSEVLASFDGKVVFSGAFQNQGKMLIIEHSDGFHTVISGLDNLYAKRGQWVLQGEPIGKMSEQNTELYVEIRKNGKHINPKSWLS